MHRLFSALLVSLFAVLLPAVAHGEAGESWYFPQMQFLALAAEDSDLSPAELSRRDDWQPTPSHSPNMGYDERVHWFRFALEHDGDSERLERMIQISYPQLDDVRFFLYRDGDRVDQLHTGDRLPFHERAVKHPQFLFPVTLEAGHDYQVLIRVESSGAIQVPIRVWEPTALFEHLSIQDQANALYYGILMVVIVFNLFIFLALRETTYLYYVLAIASYLLLMATLRGTSFAVLWPGSPWLHNQMMLASIPSAILFSALFVRAFLRLNRNNPVLDALARLAIFMGILALIGAFVLDYSTSTQFSVMLAVPAFLVLLMIGPIEWARGNRAAKFYTIAWAALSVGSATAAMNKLGWLPTNFVTEYGIQIGSALEAILLTVALAERLYRERSERVQAQDERLREHAERREAELRLIDQALHHPITTLPNRTSFEMLTREILQEEARSTHAVLVLEITNYSSIQKTLGHANTERLLEAFARHLQQQASQLPGVRRVEASDRGRHSVASLESASFALLLQGQTLREQPEALYRFIEGLREPFDFLEMQLPLNVMGGIAFYPEHGADASTLIRRAFIALETEQTRAHHLAFYQSQQDAYSAERLTLATELRRALEQNRLELHFQPKYCLSTNSICGVEGLIRWPGRAQPLAADTLIAVAEETGLIKPLTRWILRQAIVTRRRLVQAGYDITVAINISANNLREPDFPLFVQQLVERHRPYSEGLTLELTETSMMSDPISALEALRTLDSTGIPIAIDDFGSGYSSLSYMKQLPARELKIDKSLITDISEHGDDQLIVRATIEMSHSLGYSVVAEGVEDATSLSWLRHFGCDAIQGFFLARPMGLGDLVEWLGSSPFPLESTPEPGEDRRQRWER